MPFVVPFQEMHRIACLRHWRYCSDSWDQEYFDSLHLGSWMLSSSVELGMREVGGLFARCYRDYVCDFQRRLLSRNLGRWLVDYHPHHRRYCRCRFCRLSSHRDRYERNSLDYEWGRLFRQAGLRPNSKLHIVATMTGACHAGQPAQMRIQSASRGRDNEGPSSDSNKYSSAIFSLAWSCHASWVAWMITRLWVCCFALRVRHCELLLRTKLLWASSWYPWSWQCQSVSIIVTWYHVVDPTSFGRPTFSY